MKDSNYRLTHSQCREQPANLSIEPQSRSYIHRQNQVETDTYKSLTYHSPQFPYLTWPENAPGDESNPRQVQGILQSSKLALQVVPSQNTVHVGPAHGGGGTELLDRFDAQALDDELELGFELADELDKELADDDCEELLSELEAEIDGPRVGSVGAGLPVNGWAAWKSGICGAPLQIRFKSVSCW